MRNNVLLLAGVVALGVTSQPAFARGASDPSPGRMVLLGTHIVGIESLANSACPQGYPEDACTTYQANGIVGKVARNRAGGVEGFTLIRGRYRKFQNIDPSTFPHAASRWLKPGLRVEVRGTRSGQGQIDVPAEVREVSRQTL